MMLKRRHADRLEWERVTQRRFAVSEFNEPLFHGMVTLLCIDAVSEALWIKSEAQNFCIADAVYSWLQQFPRKQTQAGNWVSANHTVTTMFDANGEVVQWYLDIVKQHGVDERGVPWWDDLYLDIIVTPGGGTTILDEDELDDALNSGVIDGDDHRQAWNEANQICHLIETGKLPLLELAYEHRQKLMRIQ